MPTDLNPQAQHMADESMVRNLAAQAEAVWPQELPVLLRHPLPASPRVLDAGCGTGEATWRVAEAFPSAEVLGVDILEAHLERARPKAARYGARVRFENRSIFDLGLPSATFDLVVCRHVLQSIPHAERAVAELARVTRPGGTVHLVAEDYGMIHFPRRKFDPADVWPRVPARFGAETGTDMLFGRHAPALLHRLGLRDVALDVVVVDTLRVPRDVFARIWEAWRDGYTEVVARFGGFSAEEAAARWDDQIATIRDPDAYAAWMVPVVSGRVA